MSSDNQTQRARELANEIEDYLYREGDRHTPTGIARIILRALEGSEQSAVEVVRKMKRDSSATWDNGGSHHDAMVRANKERNVVLDEVIATLATAGSGEQSEYRRGVEDALAIAVKYQDWEMFNLPAVEQAKYIAKEIQRLTTEPVSGRGEGGQAGAFRQQQINDLLDAIEASVCRAFSLAPEAPAAVARQVGANYALGYVATLRQLLAANHSAVAPAGKE